MFSCRLVVEDRVVRSIGALKLVQALRDQKASDPIPGNKRKLPLEEVEATEGRELIEHQQEFLPSSIGIQALGQSTPDLIENEAH
jgi:hypothetical protein